MIKIDSPTDVMLVPIIRGQIINFGTPDNFDNKFRRLRRTYTESTSGKRMEQLRHYFC